MKWSLLVLSSVLVAFSYAENCYDVNTLCKTSRVPVGGCNGKFSGFANHDTLLQSYANDQIQKSFEYLILAANYGNYNKNRPGFAKQFRSLSDKAWNGGIDLIKHITKRGGEHDFGATDEIVKDHYRNNGTEYTPRRGRQTLELNEIDSLALTLDYEKMLAKDAHYIHFKYTHKEHDSEIAHFVEEKFLESQVDTIRKLSGYVNDLKNILSPVDKDQKMSKDDVAFAYYFFDDYLAKQE